MGARQPRKLHEPIVVPTPHPQPLSHRMGEGSADLSSAEEEREKITVPASCTCGNGDQTLADGGAEEVSLEGVEGRENDLVVDSDRGRIEMALLQNKKIQPPGEIAHDIK